MINKNESTKTGSTSFFARNPALTNILYSVGYYVTLKALAKAASKLNFRFL
jgi:hypothetical protein